MKSTLISLSILAITASCTPKAEPPTSDQTKVTSVVQQKALALKWEFKKLGESPTGAPQAQVTLVLNGRAFDIAKANFNFSTLNKEEYKDSNIPSEALAACKGWWAGDGIVYWVTRNDKELIVMSRESGESIDAKGNPSDYVSKAEKVKSIQID